MKFNKKIILITILSFIVLSIYSTAFEYKTIESSTKEINKIQNTDIIQEVPNSEVNSEIAKYSLKYQGNLIEGKRETSKTYVSREGYNYTYSRINGANFIQIKRYCFETGIYETVFQNWGNFDVETVRGYYVLDKVIYTAVYSTTQYDELRIIGYDTETETISYDKTFPITYEEYFGEFCVDKNQNMYFVLNGETDAEITIATYDKNGKAIDSVTKTFFDGYYDSIKLTGIDANGRVLFFSLHATSGYSWWWDDFVIRTNNGNFINDKNVYLARQYAGVTWTFLNDSQTCAYSSYGEFLEINYNANNEAGLSYTLKKTIDVDGSYAYMGYLSSSDDTYAYLGTEQGLLYIFNWNTYKIEKSLSIGENRTIVGVYKTDNDKILIEYYDETNQNYYALTLTISDYSIPQKNIEIIDHTSLTHTKEQIENKYNDLRIVNTTTDLYETIPSITAPYVAGSLKAQVKIDTINQINYFRWLSGLEKSVIQNDEYMESSQKGAVVLAANALISGNYNYLTHFPYKPSDMEDDFYTAGYNATSARFGTSANISVGELIAESVKGYVDDINNVEPNVGHRLSILDPQAVKTSFGFAGKHSVINIFSDRTITNVDSYYSWPSPGYFPAESMGANAMWSILVSKSSGYNISDLPNVVIKANGKEYSSDNADFKLHLESYYNAYYFNIPEELKSYLVDGTNTIQSGKTVEVELYGLSDNLGNTYVVKYPVNFFSLNKLSIGDVNGDGKITLADCTKILAHVKKTQLLSGDALLAADVNGDGKVTLADYTKVLAHVKKTALLS